MAFENEKEEQEVVKRLSGLLDFYLEKRTDLKERALAILHHFVEEGVVGSEQARTGSEVARKFADKYPKTSLGRTLSILERLGLLDRKTKYDGYFVSHKFLNEAERQRNSWRKILEVAEKNNRTA